MNVTLDSNVVEPIFYPSEHKLHDWIEEFKEIRRLLDRGDIQCFLGERSFHLEAIVRKQRLDVFSRYKPRMESTLSNHGGSKVSGTFSIEPDETLHPGNNEFFNRNLQTARQLGIKLLVVPRLGAIRNPYVSSKDLIEIEPNPACDNQLEGFLNSEYITRLTEILDELDTLGVGIGHIVNLGNTHRREHETWQDGIARVPKINWKAVSLAISEWADGDLVAGHYASKNDLLLTLDEAKSAGSKSVFSQRNQKHLCDKFGLEFVNPRQLLERIL